MEKEFVKKFIGENTVIGVHHYNKLRPFFYFGNLINVTDLYAELKFYHGNGYKRIPIDEIIDIHVDQKYPGNAK